MTDQPITQAQIAYEAFVGVYGNGPPAWSLLPPKDQAAWQAVANAHSYDIDPNFQESRADAYNSGIGAAAIIVAQKAEALMGDGAMPPTIPSQTLEDLYNAIMGAQKPVPGSSQQGESNG